MILRWIMDFYFGGMEKLVIDGAEYGWVNASYVCDELPIMHLNPEAVRRRLKKLVKFGLLYHRQVKNSEVGTRAYYRPTERAVQLQSGTGTTSKCDGGTTSKCDGGTTSKCDPVPLQSSNKDSSISDPSITNQSIKCDYPRFENPNLVNSNLGNGPQLSTKEQSTKEQSTKESKREPRHKYGEYQNVLLSDSDMEKLKAEFPTDWEERIENLSSYMESHGKTYKNRLATIRNWARKDREEKRATASHETTSGFNRKTDADYYYQSSGDEELDKVLGLGKYAPKTR